MTQHCKLNELILPNLFAIRTNSGKRDSEEQSAQDWAKPEGARKIEQSVAYMAGHLNEPFQVAALAQAAHVSPSHFFVLFKRWTGFSPIDYLIRLRMREACRLLGSTSLSVKEISAGLGYDDPFYFSRLFKSVHGLAPSDYRSMIEQREGDQPETEHETHSDCNV